MLAIIWMHPGGLDIFRPAEGERLAFSITLNDGSTLPEADKVPRPVDTILRHWPVDGAVAEWAETEEEFAARLLKRIVPNDATHVQIVAPETIPADRFFRRAWRTSGAGVYCDMAVAKDIARNHLRAVRVEFLRDLDGQWMRAMGRGDATAAAAIEAKREAMRGWPQDARIGSCTSPAELLGLIATMKEGWPR